MFYANKPCPICAGRDRFYLIMQPADGSAPYWRCRQCDYTEPHDEDIGEVSHDHATRQQTRTPEQIAESHLAYTVVARRCAAALWSKAGQPALDYLRGRGLSDTIIKGAGLGWCGDGADLFVDLFYHERPAYDGALTGGLRRRQGIPNHILRRTITIPYWQGDTCVLLRGRKLAVKAGEAKYLSPSGPLYAGATPWFYLHHVLLDDHAAVILTEGELKALAAHQEWRAGRSPLPCVATSGVMYLPPALVEALRGKTVYLAYDNERPRRGGESPGERAISRNGAKLRAAGIAVKVITLPRADDQAKVDLDSFILSSRTKVTP